MIRNVRLNYTLNNGMLITSARLTKGKPFAKLFITDLYNTARAALDLEGEHVVYCNAAITFTSEDIRGLITAIKTALKPKTPAPTKTT